jgi:hypothetical protein
MKTSKNLQAFVAEWPQGVTVICSTVDNNDLATMSEDLKWQIADNHGYMTNRLEVSRKGDKWYMYRRTTELRRRGRTFYPKTTLAMQLSIVDGKIVTIKDLTWSHIESLQPRYEWLEQIQTGRFGNTITNKTLLKEVLLGNITNPEAYYKWILKHTYRTDAIPWKLFREYAKSPMRISIFDIIEATINPKLAIEAYLNASDHSVWRFRGLLEDSILTALRLGEKINPQWSEKRLQAEHQRHIDMIQLRKIESMDNNPASHVFDAFDFPEGVKWLNTEGEVFKEASKMHHCLHSNYWSHIKRGDYVAFAIDHDGEHFTLGCRFTGDFCMYDQAHTAYNGSVSHANHVWITDFIRDLDRFLGRQRTVIDFDWNLFIREYDLPY